MVYKIKVFLNYLKEVIIFFNRIIVIILDGAGTGSLPDAYKFGDEGSDTLGHVALSTKLNIPALLALGLGKIVNNLCPSTGGENTQGAAGKMAQQSAGKDTITGHWELAGLILKTPFPVFHKGFPPGVINFFEQLIGRKTLGNIPASGTEIIQRLGEEHLKTGYPIVYTSADSVFQVAAHEDIIPRDLLYEWCLLAREDVLTGNNAVARVIARPFKGEPGNFWRTEGRRDFSLPPPEKTLLDLAENAGYEVNVIGKVLDIFAGRGITQHLPAYNNHSCLEKVSFKLRESFAGILWTTLTDFDMLYGHRNDVKGFASELEIFDQYLSKNILPLLNKTDCLIITADHGCDPTFNGTDHTREYVPLLIYTPGIVPTYLGTRNSFADLGRTITDFLCCEPTIYGESFAKEIIKRRDPQK